MAVAGIILAAGASRRMGSPKSLLPLGGGTFLSRIAGTLRAAGVCDIVVVLGAEAEAVRSALQGTDAKVVVNERWEEGQLSSLVAGLDALRETTVNGALVWPVDRPLAGLGVVRELLGAFVSSGRGIIVPSYHGRRGHPVLFSNTMITALRAASPAVGAREVLSRFPADIVEIATEDTGILRNIDTPEDLKHLGVWAALP